MNYKLLLATIFSLTVVTTKATEQSKATEQQPSVLCNQCNQSTVCDRCTWEEEIIKLEAQVKVIDEILENKIPESDTQVITIGVRNLIVGSCIVGTFIAAARYFGSIENSFAIAAISLLPMHLLDTWVRLKTDLNTGTPKEFVLALKQEKSELEDKITIYKQALAATAVQPIEDQLTEAQPAQMNAQVAHAGAQA